MKSTASKKTVKKATAPKETPKRLRVAEVPVKSQFDLKCACADAQGTADKAPLLAISANVDVGFGNQLFIRGEGCSLSWDKGVPLTCMEGSTWRWEGFSDQGIVFKLLLNDSIWARGENLKVLPGQTLEITPAF